MFKQCELWRGTDSESHTNYTNISHCHVHNIQVMCFNVWCGAWHSPCVLKWELYSLLSPLTAIINVWQLCDMTDKDMLHGLDTLLGMATLWHDGQGHASWIHCYAWQLCDMTDDTLHGYIATHGNSVTWRTTTRFMDTLFAAKHPAACNSLPGVYLWNTDLHSAFCRHIKTHLFALLDILVCNIRLLSNSIFLCFIFIHCM